MVGHRQLGLQRATPYPSMRRDACNATTSPMPRWYLLISKLLSSTLLSLAQVYVFLLIAWLYGIKLPPLTLQ